MRGLVVTLALVLGCAAPAMAQGESVPCMPEPTDMSIDYGDVVQCDLVNAGDTDLFRFSGTAGETVVVLLTFLDAPFPSVELFGPDDERITVATGTSNAFLRASLDQSGSHKLLIRTGSGGTSFVITLERVAPVPSPNAHVVCQGCQTPTETLEPRGEMDTFHFAGSAGNTIVVQMTLQSGTFPSIELYAPSGTFVGSATGTSTAVLNAQLPESGTYTLLARHGSASASVAYTLSFQCLSCPPLPPTCVVEPSFAGGTLTLHFTLGTPNPAQWHVAMLAAGQVFTFWRVPLPIINPGLSFTLPIPGFPSLGTLGLLSTLTAGADLVCTQLRTVDTTP